MIFVVLKKFNKETAIKILFEIGLSLSIQINFPWYVSIFFSKYRYKFNKYYWICCLLNSLNYNYTVVLKMLGISFSIDFKQYEYKTSFV